MGINEVIENIGIIGPQSRSTSKEFNAEVDIVEIEVTCCIFQQLEVVGQRELLDALMPSINPP